MPANVGSRAFSSVKIWPNRSHVLADGHQHNRFPSDVLNFPFLYGFARWYDIGLLQASRHWNRR